jgi:hypothetical protein
MFAGSVFRDFSGFALKMTDFPNSGQDLGFSNGIQTLVLYGKRGPEKNGNSATLMWYRANFF